VGDQTALRRDEEGAIENMPGDHDNDRRGILTISDNVVTMGESAEGEDGAGWPHPHPGDLLEGAQERYGKSHNGGLCRSVPAL
jgi:hypothetical protein